jgi:hypothetical protein
VMCWNLFLFFVFCFVALFGEGKAQKYVCMMVGEKMDTSLSWDRRVNGKGGFEESFGKASINQVGLGRTRCSSKRGQCIHAKALSSLGQARKKNPLSKGAIKFCPVLKHSIDRQSEDRSGWGGCPTCFLSRSPQQHQC